MSHSFLEAMSVQSQVRVEHSRSKLLLNEVVQQAAAVEPAKPLEFSDDQLSIIAEFKRSAPSSGALAHGVALDRQVKLYTSGGASAISVLTEPTKFDGSNDDLLLASFFSDLPLIRKDFLVDPYQVYEARSLSASGVLLIVRMLIDDVLADMLQTVDALGMFALVEAFDEDDVKRAIDFGASIIGINSRNLADLSVDVDRFEKLRPLITGDTKVIAESGIKSSADIKRLVELDYDGVLIGSTFMKNAEPEMLLKKFVSAGKRAPSKEGA